jgi:hypothetical protein
LNFLETIGVANWESKQLFNASNLPQPGIIGRFEDLLVLQEKGVVGLREKNKLPQYTFL